MPTVSVYLPQKVLDAVRLESKEHGISLGSALTGFGGTDVKESSDVCDRVEEKVDRILGWFEKNEEKIESLISEMDKKLDLLIPKGMPEGLAEGRATENIGYGELVVSSVADRIRQKSKDLKPGSVVEVDGVDDESIEKGIDKKLTEKELKELKAATERNKHKAAAENLRTKIGKLSDSPVKDAVEHFNPQLKNKDKKAK